MSTENPLVGKVITAVHIADDKGAIKFDVEGGEPIIAQADGDCCSKSWIESVENIEALIGATVREVRDLDLTAPFNGKPTPEDQVEVIAYYGCKITTEKGDCVIDFRNDSNGYYGGNLSWPGEYFYGGVYDQNKSKMEWRKVGS